MVILFFAVFIYSIVVHEVAHAYAANLFGDSTAKNEGRITFNPISHIDLWWSILLPVMMYMSTGMLFGGAKPVPINPLRFYNRRLGMSLVSLAGPLSNLTLAFSAAALLNVLIFINFAPYGFVELLFKIFQINIVLAVFNLIPIPPLDGSKLLVYFMPPEYEYTMYRMEFIGFIILIAVMMTGAFSKIINFVLAPAYQLVIPYQVIGILMGMK